MKTSSKYLNASIADSFRTAVKSPNNSPTKMMYLTSYGFITGIPKSPTSQSVNSDDYLTESLSKSNELDLNVIRIMKNEFIVNSEEEVELIDDGSFIVLSAVKIYHNSLDNPVLTLNNFMLHTSDIIGITYIPIDSGL